MPTYVELVKSTPFVAEVIGRLNLQRDPFEVSRAVKASLVGTTQLIRIDVDGAEPAQAAAIANALAALLIDQERGERIGVVGACRRADPAQAHLELFPALGLLVGLVGGGSGVPV
jgi:capsular polysaccharide biosynthesis protein